MSENFSTKINKDNKFEYDNRLDFDELLLQKTEEGWNYVGIEDFKKIPPDIEDLKTRYSQGGKKEVEVVPYQEDSYLIFTKIKQ